jgi:ligand-binding sensor domain-containing protein/signal transduction histidine kinase
MVRFRLLSLALLGCFFAWGARGVILWSDLGEVVVRDNGPGSDITEGAVKRDDTAADVLYFKFRVDPLSDVTTELYLAAFQLFEGESERLAMGNSRKAWAYSAFNTSETGQRNEVPGDLDLRSARPETTAQLGVFYSYEFPRRGAERTIVFRVQYVPGADDLVTVWLDPDLSPGAAKQTQSTNIITQFKANASFDQIHLRHNGGGEGWSFSEMAVATSFNDFVRTGGATLQGPRPVASSLSIRSWQHEQGLPHDAARCLAQTPDGYLWIGSDDGVSRFDGVRFLSFGEREGITAGRIQALLADSSGTLWIGSAAKGLAFGQMGGFKNLTTTNGLPSDSITALAEDGKKRVWVGTDRGLAVVDGGKVTQLDDRGELQGRTVTALLRGQHEVMWVAISGAGVFRCLSDKFVPLKDASVDPLLLDTHCILEDHAGRIWIGAGDDFVLCQEGDQWHRYRVPRRVARPYVKSLAEGPDGTVWAGSVSEGVFRFQSGRWEPLNASGGLSDNSIQTLLIDHEGSLWVGTESGLNRIRRNNLVVLSQAEGLGYAPVRAMAEVAPGTVWVAQPGQGIFAFDGRRFTRAGDADFSTRFSDVNSMFVDAEHSCWVATDLGVAHLREEAGRSPGEEERDGLDGKRVFSLGQDSRKNIWAGTSEGELWRFHDHRWMQQTNLAHRLPIHCLAIDSAGTVWIGTPSSGVWQYRASARSLTRIETTSQRIKTLAVDSENALWIGTAGGGLMRWHDGKAQNLTMAQGLPDDTISQILRDPMGGLWIGTERGIAHLGKKEIHEAFASGTSLVYPRLYGRAEGMMAEECVSGFSSAGLVTRSGLLWFPTIKGIAVIDPEHDCAPQAAPQVVLEGIVIDGVSIAKAASLNSDASAAAPIRIGPGRHALELDYSCPTFRAPERARFRYQLGGLDPAWVDAKSRRAAVYAYVPPGDYRFQVVACDSDGRWSGSGAGVAIVVAKHYWQSWSFITGASIALIALVALSARVVEKRKQQRRVLQLERERAVERERARIAQDLHDDLGSSLTRVSLLGDLLRADKDSPAQVEVHAGKISHTARQTVRSLEEIVWALRPGSDTLPSLIDYIAHVANEMFESDSVRCRMDLPHDLPAYSIPPELRHNIFLIVKEALNNSLKHSGAREVRLEVKAMHETLDLIVGDDGAGFDATAARNGGGPRHNGLGNMRRRAKAIHGDLEVRSSAATGTTVRLSVKLPCLRDNSAPGMSKPETNLM